MNTMRLDLIKSVLMRLLLLFLFRLLRLERKSGIKVTCPCYITYKMKSWGFTIECVQVP